MRGPDGVPERGCGRQPGGVRGQPANPGHVPAEAHGPALAARRGEPLPPGHGPDTRG